MNNTEKIAVFGDWHGDTDFGISAIDHIQYLNPGVKHVMHVGDFGFWEPNTIYQTCSEEDADFIERVDFGSPAHEEAIERLFNNGSLEGYLHAINNKLYLSDMTLYVTLGNHEKYWFLEEDYGYVGVYDSEPVDYTVSLSVGGDNSRGLRDKYGFIASQLYPRIRIAPRGHSWTMGSKKFGSLGGAFSIDKGFRVRGYTWFPEEMPTMEQVEALPKNLDVLITHDGPLSTTSKLYESKPSLPPFIQRQADHSSTIIQKALDRTQPHLLIHGHHHVRYSDTEQGTTVIGLGDNNGHHAHNVYYVDI